MSFTLTCDKCGHKVTLQSENFKDLPEINVHINRGYHDDAEAEITCNNPECENRVTQDYS